MEFHERIRLSFIDSIISVIPILGISGSVFWISSLFYFFFVLLGVLEM